MRPQSRDEPVGVPVPARCSARQVKTPEGQPRRCAGPVADLAGKFQQVTAPVTAKGLEDTAFYVYNRLVSLNEVGGEPDRFGVSPQLLHEWNQRPGRTFPPRPDRAFHARHQAERRRSSADQRALGDSRGMVSSREAVVGAEREIPRRRVGRHAAPDRNDEYLFYQTLLGAWPLEALDDEAFAGFRDRIRAYMSKAAHEAKRPHELADSQPRLTTRRSTGSSAAFSTGPAIVNSSTISWHSCRLSATMARSIRWPRRCSRSLLLECPTPIREPRSGIQPG